MRTEPLEGAPETATLMGDFAFRKRLDGGYTIANGLNTLDDLVPDSFRLLADFLPALRLEYRSLHFRLGRPLPREWRTPTTLAARRALALRAGPRPRSGARTLVQRAAARASLGHVFPAFAKARVAQQWAGLIDVTPDAVPVISPVDSLPGFFIATGFSGHGFGIGPGAGRLVADLVTGSDPIVDPTPFRFSRFSDGSRPRPIAGI